uniref:Cytokine receptor CRFB4 n=1 Tax=Tetraodon nigroviridis TaxID=99883 RepID=Q800E8_TETNG|nr:cytokine receptor CRFB4 [Tetraodon nigroviridis]
MLKCADVFIGTVLSLLGSAVTSAAVNAPTNVSLSSYNMDLVLRWDPPEGAAAGVRYTAGLLRGRSFRNFTEDHCVNVSSTWCDLHPQTISPYGSYTGQVKALLGDQSSDWASSLPVTLDIDTVIGPPNVTLLSSGTTMDVSIRDPEFAVSKFKEVYNQVQYHLTYWEDGRRADNVNNQSHSLVTLSGLKARTRYCVQVQVSTRNPRPSGVSRPVCERTGESDGAPWAVALLTFLLLAAILALGLVAACYRRSISHVLCPRDALPSHLKEYLLAPPTSAVKVWSYSQPEEVFHQVSVAIPQEDGGATGPTEPEAAEEEQEQEEEEQEEEEQEQEEEP